MRRLLDEEFKKYFGGLREQSRPAEDHLPSPPPSSPSAPPANQLEVIPPPQPSSPSPQSPSPSPQSDALTERIFPDTPPLSPDSSVDPISIFDTLESLITQFPRTTTASIPQGAYTIGSHYFDPEEIRNAITGQNSTSCIPVFLPNSAIPISSGILLQSFPSFLRFHPRNRLIKSHPSLPTTRCT
ncbi:hypothetical protein ALC56_13948 [Trachymyrmex septentrionalis]|uniref:Uncharacterized protein n=1 Tax=Trachymyrmex septentrionalis TaxID=34720 RepID=A0A195EV95_9HYME|nr:hypothetical protein ALC56_13948 [Trachymyrmex septentrionalis]